MGAPMPDMAPVENASAEALLSSLKTIEPGERRKHASVFNYWQSIRANRQFPPIRDLDPLEISDAGPWSVLLEMIGGGEDAVIRHFGQEIRRGIDVEKIGDAPNPSLLTCIHAKLPIVAACREAFAFEDAYDAGEGKRRCWVTLLPFSANGTWIDFVYGYVSLERVETVVEEEVPEPVEGEPEAAEVLEEPEVAEVVDEPVEVEPEVAEAVEQPIEDALEPFKVPLAPLDELEEEPLPVEEALEDPVEEQPEPEIELTEEYVAEPEAEDSSEPKASFTNKVKESLASVGFYGKVVQAGPELPAESFVEEAAPVEVSAPEPRHEVEGSMQSKLTNVRALAEEAHQAQVRSNLALYEGLSAAYDFALDAEGAPEDYLKLVEAQGLKIQLRSPMKPVVRLAFEGMCDDPTIAKLEAVLAWALKQDLPRGALRERIEEAGGLGPILRGEAAA